MNSKVALAYLAISCVLLVVFLDEVDQVTCARARPRPPTCRYSALVLCSRCCYNLKLQKNKGCLCTYINSKNTTISSSVTKLCNYCGVNPKCTN
ncbi:hypothetical protein OROMI_009948 [Orobanche minor]